MKFETGKIGRQADGAAIAQTGDSMVYSTVCSERDPTPVDFTPLRVDYFARYSAVGQTIGAFHRRDSRGDDNEILVARLIDRPIRPMIIEGWQHDTQILAWVLSYDKIHPCEALSVCAASAAISISHVPMIRPVAAVEVGLVEGQLMVNPTKQQMANSTLSLTIAGTKEGILMIEGAADFLPEELMVTALKIGHAAIGEICDAISAFQKVAGKPKKLDTLRKLPIDLVDNIDQLFGDRLTAALSISEKHIRGAAVAEVERSIVKRFVKEEAPSAALSGIAAVSGAQMEGVAEKSDSGAPQLLDPLSTEEDISVYSVEAAQAIVEPGPVDSVLLEDEASELNSIAKSSISGGSPVGYGLDPVDVKVAVKKLLVRKLRNMILHTGKRSDGRSVEEVRPISSETSLLPMAHGSSLFTRGETQALATATLGSKAMEARYETLDTLGSKRFYLQYRFPPSSVGEVGRVGGVNRREVGHGNLAERALLPSLPPGDVFPYSIRAESLITESCGSSSMATVCACCLAMLDAGVPLTSSVAGVAMGLILGEKSGDKPVILTDILGLEDALGTMDFKVAGNETGITTFQLDIKSEGLTLEILEEALLQAKRGRLHILQEMKSCLDSPRKLKDTIPKIMEFSIAPEALGKVIGPKGKTVQTLIETYGLVNINLEDDGSIQVESYSTEKNDLVKAAILKIVEESQAPSGGKRGGDKAAKEEPTGPPPEVGIIYRDCEVKGIHNFGVFVEVLPGYEGLIHISELDIKKVLNVESAGFVIGQKMDVKYLGKNEKGQMRLSRRAVLMRDSSSLNPMDNNNSSTNSIVDSNNNSTKPW
eukprot:CAMPEP_0170079124 /NCGR_PEP_ID=MMETSP0019_2-20121128/15589_1 /TAXON_ID=98059 /ORGANISM="Dinobryon sp., Strain UTEXLB2267" /LENGTH=821 /DNA_ID=CAMNT_0010292435 /DNA_START=140 /DNA_END=2602 /DNA_ORIENTATION=+